MKNTRGKREELTVIEVEGSAEKRGESYGSQAGADIKSCVDFFYRIFSRQWDFRESSSGQDFSWREIRNQARNHAEKYWPAIADYSPVLAAEMKGIARGAGVDWRDIVMIALNEERESIVKGLKEEREISSTDGQSMASDGQTMAPGGQSTVPADGQSAASDGQSMSPGGQPTAPAGQCTAFAATGRATRSGRTLLGQSWDNYLEWYEGFPSFLLRRKNSEGFEALSYAYPGMLAAAGINSAGIALCWNSVPRLKLKIGVPTYVIVAEVLRQETIGNALAAVFRAERAGCFNFLLANEEEIYNLEATPDDIEVSYSADYLGHANHYLTKRFRQEERRQEREQREGSRGSRQTGQGQQENGSSRQTGQGQQESGSSRQTGQGQKERSGQSREQNSRSDKEEDGQNSQNLNDSSDSYSSKEKSKRRASTLIRHNRICRRLKEDAGNISTAKAGEFLRDHVNYPHSICRHPDKDSAYQDQLLTRAAWIMEPAEREILITAGPPCRYSFKKYTFS